MKKPECSNCLDAWVVYDAEGDWCPACRWTLKALGIAIAQAASHTLAFELGASQDLYGYGPLREHAWQPGCRRDAR